MLFILIFILSSLFIFNAFNFKAEDNEVNYNSNYTLLLRRHQRTKNALKFLEIWEKDSSEVFESSFQFLKI
jgi:hypothetical protein